MSNFAEKITMKKKYYILIVALLIGSVVYANDDLRLPNIGDSSGGIISPHLEHRLGMALLREVRKQGLLVDDLEIENYINSIGYRLAANSDDNTLPFVFFVLNNPQINAFAAPGGVIGINSGIILNSQSESELAGVMAHEIAHVTQRHMARSFEKAGQLGLSSTITMLGAILVGIIDPNAAQLATAIAAGTSVQAQLNFTRANEEEADNIGIQLLARAGYDPFGMPNFFRRLQEASSGQQNESLEFLRTHPLTSSRIAESLTRADRYPRKSYGDSLNYELIRAKIRARSYKSPHDAVKMFEAKLKSEGHEDSLRYGYVVALMGAGEYQKAKQQSRILLSQNQENISYLLMAAQIEEKHNNYAGAMEIYRKAQAIYPNYRPLTLAYAKALLDSEQPVEAEKLLQDYNRKNEPDDRYYSLLAQAQAQFGKVAESAITQAEYYYSRGDTQLAVEQLQFVQRQHKLGYYLRSRVSARLTQLEQELELEKDLNF